MCDGLVLRYDTATANDGLPPGEGMFLACSFWLVDAYLMLGRQDDAARLFERLLSLRNDVGLLSEQYDPRARRLVGNFPQAFSHLALVNSASNLAHYRKPAEQRSQHAVDEGAGAGEAGGLLGRAGAFSACVQPHREQRDASENHIDPDKQPHGPGGGSRKIEYDDARQDDVDNAACDHPGPAPGELAPVFHREHDGCAAFDQEEQDQYQPQWAGCLEWPSKQPAVQFVRLVYDQDNADENCK